MLVCMLSVEERYRSVRVRVCACVRVSAQPHYRLLREEEGRF